MTNSYEKKHLTEFGNIHDESKHIFCFYSKREWKIKNKIRN